MVEEMGIIKEIFIPETDNSDIITTNKIGFKIQVNGEIITVIEEQDGTNCNFLKNDIVKITRKNIDGKDFIDLEESNKVLCILSKKDFNDSIRDFLIKELNTMSRNITFCYYEDLINISNEELENLKGDILVISKSSLSPLLNNRVKQLIANNYHSKLLGISNSEVIDKLNIKLQKLNENISLLDSENAKKYKQVLTYCQERLQKLSLNNNLILMEISPSDIDNFLSNNYFLTSDKGLNDSIIYLDTCFQNDSWIDMYKLAKAYYEHHKNLYVPNDFTTNDGYTFDKEGKNLYNWIEEQKEKSKNSELLDYQKDLLNKLGIDWQLNNDLRWDKYYNLAKSYYHYHHNLEVPKRFVTKNGYDYDSDGDNLGFWIFNQRASYKRGELSSARIEKLNQIGMRFVCEDADTKWFNSYQLLKAYKEHNGNLDIPEDFKTINGYEYDDNGKNIRNFLESQKAINRSGGLSPQKKKLLEELGVDLTYIDRNKEWGSYYQLVKAYYEHYKNIQVPINFCTENGYEYSDSEDSKNIYTWLNTQKARYRANKLSKERQILLEEIGFKDIVTKTKSKGNNEVDKKWLQNFALAKKYYEHNHNLKIPRRFRTKDGYTYDNNGKQLGVWLQYQKTLYNLEQLSKEKEQLLLTIGLDFEEDKNNKRKIQICKEHNIDYKRNTSVITNITCEELIAKTNFLIANGMELTDKKKKLHEIYSMSSPDMKKKYGFDLEEIVNEYALTKSIKKGV